MNRKILIIAITLAICTASAAAEAAQVPFMVSGYVFYEGGSACNNPDVAITNLNTSETFPTMTLQSSNYYRADPTPQSSDVSEGDLLQFTVGTGSATLDHRVTASDLAFGLFLNLTVGVDGDSVAAVTGSGAGAASIVVPETTPTITPSPQSQQASPEWLDSPAQTPTPEPEPVSHEPVPVCPGWERKVPGFGAAVTGLAMVLCLMFRRRMK